MIPKTKYRKRIEEERCRQLERRCGVPKVYINGNEPWRYFGDVCDIAVHQVGDRPLISVDATVGNSRMRYTTGDFIFDTIKNRLDLFIDE